MGLLDSMFPVERRQSLENPSVPLSDWFKIFGGIKTKAGVRINEESGLAISPAWSAVNLISSGMASLPIHVYERTDAGKERVRDSAVARLLNEQPNPEITAQAFRENLQAHALTWGNGYAEIERDESARVRALWPITPDRVAVYTRELPDGRTMKWFIVMLPNGGLARIEPRNMLHIYGLGLHPYCGRSVISMARESLGLTKAAEEFGQHFFGQGTRSSGVLQAPQGVKFTEQTIRQLRESWAEIQQGLENSHRIVILQDGLTWQQTSVPPNDSQFLETRKFQVAEIARWFQVPPHMIGDLERATFSNIEHQDLAFDKRTLLRWVKKWDQELNIKLLGSRAASRRYAETLMEGVLRADTATRSSFYQAMIDRGVYSPNEVRELENRNPIAGGDKHFINAGGTPVLLTQIGEMPEPAPPPDPEPDPPAGGDAAAARRQRAALAMIGREVDRMLQHEVGQVRGILNDTMRRQDVAELRRRLRAFYDDRSGWVAGRIQPIFRLYATVVAGVDADAEVDAFVERLAAEWVTGRATELSRVIDSTEPDQLEAAIRKMLDAWPLMVIGNIEVDRIAQLDSVIQRRLAA